MIRIAIFSGIIGVMMAPLFASAFEATSTSFKLLDPTFTVTGGFATSTSYQLNQATVQPALGTSTITSFQINPGFLYFPFVTKPVVTATAGNNSVTLSWTASQGFLGWNVSGYNVGQAIISGGPYTYSLSLGNVLSSKRGGLSNGTTYYFIVRAEDALGNSIATSSEVVATPVVGPAVTPTPSVSALGSDSSSIIKNFLIPLIAALHEPLVLCAGGTPGDLNCDRKVGLQDLSILLLSTRALSAKEMSVFLSHWTEPLLTFLPESPRNVLPRAVLNVIAPRKETAAINSAGLFGRVSSTVQKKEEVAVSRLAIRVRVLTQPLNRAVSFGGDVLRTLRNALSLVFLSWFNAVWRR